MNMEILFLQLIKDYNIMIRKYCYIYSNAYMPFEDLYQEVLINLWKSFPNFKGESKESTWIYRITINTCISFIRKKHKSVDFTPLSFQDNKVDDNENDMENIEELYRRINKLEPLERSMIMLWIDGKSHDEIATILKMTKTNVSTRLSRIKIKLEQEEQFKMKNHE
jgi:RNA polymerase sigma-70 factor, ECF subfamily